jgi:hypothetical protein
MCHEFLVIGTHYKQEGSLNGLETQKSPKLQVHERGRQYPCPQPALLQGEPSTQFRLADLSER